jgi:hypothetical protein
MLQGALMFFTGFFAMQVCFPGQNFIRIEIFAAIFSSSEFSSSAAVSLS